MTEHRSSFEGRVAVVTGAGSGIGRAVAGRLVAGGATVIGVDLSAERLDETGTALDGPGPFTPVAGDLTDPDLITAVVAAADAAGGAAVLCNNAGIIDRMVPVHQVDDDDWDRVMAVNVTAPLRLTRAVVPGMVARGAGAIVNTASVAGLRGGAGGAAYTISKHAVIGLTRSTAWAYAGDGVRCNAVCPGSVATSISRNVAPRDPEAMALWTPVQALIPRQGQPDELASVITYLASDDARFVNGAVVTADGGWHAG